MELCFRAWINCKKTSQFYLQVLIVAVCEVQSTSIPATLMVITTLMALSPLPLQEHSRINVGAASLQLRFLHLRYLCQFLMPPLRPENSSTSPRPTLSDPERTSLLGPSAPSPHQAPPASRPQNSPSGRRSCLACTSRRARRPSVESVTFV